MSDFPSSLTADNLNDLSFVVSAVCAGNVVFRSRSLNVKFMASTAGMMKMRKLRDGSVCYWTEKAQDLEKWYSVYWVPLHQAAVDMNHTAWSQAVVRLYQFESGDLSIHESNHDYHYASPLVCLSVAGCDSSTELHYRAALAIGRELYTSLRLYRYGEKTMVRQAFHAGSLAKLDQFKRPGLLLSCAVASLLSETDTAQRYRQQWIDGVFSDSEYASVTNNSSANWFTGYLKSVTGLFTELWREIFVIPRIDGARTAEQVQAEVQRIRQSPLCASNPYPDRIPDVPGQDDFLFCLSLPGEADGSHHESSEYFSGDRMARLNQVQPTDQIVREGKDEQI